MAEGEDDSSKTEQPSQKKLEEARKRGEVVLSRELNHWFMILAMLLFIMLAAGSTMRQIGELLTPYISHPEALPSIDEGSLGQVLKDLVKSVLFVMILPLIMLMIAAAAGTLIQIGPLWSTEHLEPKLERISLIGGVGRLFSKRNLLEFLKGLAKLTVVAIVVSWMAWPIVPTIEHTMDMSLPAMFTLLKGESLRILFGVLAVMFLIAAIDYVAQYLMFMSQQRMTRSELKEEYKQSEGDPQIKQKLRQIRMERARRRMMAEVPKADVIVTNPDHYAVALKYNPAEHPAPVVVAMGVDQTAQKIKEIAREHEIPIVENPPLARALYATADLDMPIPGEHYRAVAEIISYVMKLKQGLRPPVPRPSGP